MNLKKVLCFMLVAVVSLSSVSEVRAAGVTTGQSTVQGVDGTTLYESQDAEWGYQAEAEVTYDNNQFEADVLVIIPKSIALDDTKSAEYEVAVKGSIERALGVSVAPHDNLEDVEGVNFLMSMEGRDDVVATVVQDETVWDYREITEEGTIKKGTITANDLTRGQWKGALKFDINMGEEYGLKCNPDDLSDANHQYDNGICSACGAVDPSKHSHQYQSKVIKEATCSVAGETTYSCACGDSYTEPIDMKAHNYVDGICTECGADESLGYGLFAEDGTLLASWQSLVDDYGLNVEADYTAAGQAGNLGGVLANEGLSDGVRLVVGKDVEKIGNYAMSANSRLTNIELPESLKFIGSRAFQQNTKLSSITIPSGVTSIGSVPFMFCLGLESINVEEGNKTYKSQDGVLYSGNVLLEYPCNKADETYSVPSGVTSIAEQAFYYAKNVKEVLFPSTLSSIGSQAFVNCGALRNVDLSGTSVSVIANSCFKQCGSLLMVDLNNGVCRSIEDDAFNSNPAMRYIYLGNSITSVSNSTLTTHLPFYGCNQLNICCAFNDAKRDSLGTEWRKYSNDASCNTHTNFQYDMFKSLRNTILSQQ